MSRWLHVALLGADEKKLGKSGWAPSNYLKNNTKSKRAGKFHALLLLLNEKESPIEVLIFDYYSLLLKL